MPVVRHGDGPIGGSQEKRVVDEIGLVRRIGIPGPLQVAESTPVGVMPTVFGPRSERLANVVGEDRHGAPPSRRDRMSPSRCSHSGLSALLTASMAGVTSVRVSWKWRLR